MKDYKSVLEIDEVWPVSTDIHPNGGIGVSWSAQGIGFGEYVLWWGDDGKLHADTEYMDKGEHKEFTEAILAALVKEIIIDE